MLPTIESCRRALLPIACLLFALNSPPAEATESCRHLGVIEIKIANQHCGYLETDRKMAVQDVACSLADQEEEALQREAREGSTTCRAMQCEGSLRRWQNIYTHVLSQNCWTECGWAWVVECDARQEEAPEAEPEAPERDDTETDQPRGSSRPD